jgi:hypothetical protein
MLGGSWPDFYNRDRRTYPSEKPVEGIQRIAAKRWLKANQIS